MSYRRLIFVNRVYWPNEAATAQLLHDLTSALAREGVPVTVITSRARGQAARETVDGVTVRRIRASTERRLGLLARGANDAAFVGCALGAVLQEAKRNDVVVSMTDPPLLGVVVTAAARLKGARVWHWCQDVYPEVARAVSPSRVVGAALRSLVPLRDLSWRASDGLVVLGADMARLVAHRGVPKDRIHVVPNWAVSRPSADRRPSQAFRSEAGVDGKFVVMYSGNLGRVHVFEPLLDAARRLREHAEIVFLFVGAGPQFARVADAVRAAGLGNVKFVPPQPRNALAASLGAADLQVVTLRPGCEGTVWPSKFYGAVAAERPLLYIGPAEAEIAGHVAKHGLGGSFRPEESEAAAELIAHLADDEGARAAIRERVRAFAGMLPGVAGAVAHWKSVAGSAR